MKKKLLGLSAALITAAGGLVAAGQHIVAAFVAASAGLTVAVAYLLPTPPGRGGRWPG